MALDGLIAQVHLALARVAQRRNVDDLTFILHLALDLEAAAGQHQRSNTCSQITTLAMPVSSSNVMKITPEAVMALQPP